MGTLLSKIMVPISIGLLVTVVVVAISLSNAFRKSAVETSVIKAKETIQQYKLLRSYYTKNVVAKVQATSQLKVSVNHKSSKNTIPLPATMIHDLSQEAAQNNLDIQLKLYSRFPFPNRRDRILDGFANEAITYLEDNSDGIYFRQEQRGEQDYVRVAIADRLVETACVDCHNSHPDTPKSDWKLGDVRGILEVSSPINLQLQQSRNAMLSGIALIVVIGMGVLGALFFSVNKVVKPIQAITEGLSAGANQLLSASQEISAFSQSLSASTTEQASNIEETSSAMEEMASMANQNAEHANSANTRVQESREVFDAGAKSVINMTNSMAEINIAFQKINKIVRSIDEIAFETNLLSLNASLEASDAGVNGKRFSVVAEEVRLLSEKASEAAHETVQLIEGANQRIQSGNEIATSLKNSFSEVEEGATNIANLVGEIRAASSEQAQGCQHVNRALAHLDQSTQGNAASAQQASASAEELAAQANHMREIVAQLNELISGKPEILSNPHKSNGFQNFDHRIATSKSPTRKMKIPPSPIKEVAELSKVGQGVSELADNSIASSTGPSNDQDFKSF